MANRTAHAGTVSSSTRADAPVSWVPLVILVLAQLQMGINVNAMPVSLGPIAEDLNVPSTAVGTALVLYSLFVAATVMLGAKIGRLFGERLVFQIGVAAHGFSMALMALATDSTTMNTAQAIAGFAAALLVPTLVVLIASNYQERQQETALGVLASVPAIASGLAFIVAGFIATALSWRYSFWMIVAQSIIVLVLSFQLKPVRRKSGVSIDFIGFVLSAAAVSLILLGFNNLNRWGPLVAKEAAPVEVLGISPAPMLVLLGIVLGQAFFAWSERRVKHEKSPLLSLEVLDSSEEKNAVIAFLVAGGLGPAVSFLIPLYIQIVQGRTPLYSAVVIVPYALAIAAAAILTVRLYDRHPPRRLGVISFSMVAGGLTLVAFTVSNGWGTPTVVLGLLVVGVGEGTLLTLLFNVLVSASPKQLAGDVGALRGVANNVSSALGSAFVGVVAVGLLSVMITSAFAASNLPPALEYEINFQKIDFVSNDDLSEVLSVTSATPEQVDEAVNINEDARLRALKAAFLVLAGIALLAVVPATGLPNFVPGALPSEETADLILPVA